MSRARRWPLSSLQTEVREAHSPDRDTLDMCWPVVNAVLNDLADSQPEAT